MIERKPVMAGIAAADLDAELGGREIELVVEHDDVAERDLEEAHRLAHGPAGLRS